MPAITSYHLRGKSRDSYLDLVMAFPLTSIQSDDHLRDACRVMDELLSRSSLDRGAETYLDALSDLVATYEAAHHPIEPASDADMLRHLLDVRDLTPAALSQASGIAKSSLSEVLAGKRPFSRAMIRKLADFFNVDVGTLAANL